MAEGGDSKFDKKRKKVAINAVLPHNVIIEVITEMMLPSINSQRMMNCEKSGKLP